MKRLLFPDDRKENWADDAKLGVQGWHATGSRDELRRREIPVAAHIGGGIIIRLSGVKSTLLPSIEAIVERSRASESPLQLTCVQKKL